VVAEKAGKRLVVQCKKYSSPVGNGAVQEIHAARVFENANFAAVVSNAGYTKSAKELARATSVFLLHHLDLLRIDRVLVLDVWAPESLSHGPAYGLLQEQRWRFLTTLNARVKMLDDTDSIDD
jgi:hypothetical protein